MKRFIAAAILTVALSSLAGAGGSPSSQPAVTYVHWTRAECAVTIPCIPSVVVYISSSDPAAIGYRVMIVYRTSSGALGTQMLFAAQGQNVFFITGQPAGIIPWTYAYFDLRNIDSGDITVLGVSVLPVEPHGQEVSLLGEG